MAVLYKIQKKGREEQRTIHVYTGYVDHDDTPFGYCNRDGANIPAFIMSMKMWGELTAGQNGVSVSVFSEP